MSTEGLNLLSCVITNGATGTLLRLDEDLFLDDELDAFRFCRDHFRAYQELPQLATVVSETGIRMPVANEPLAYYMRSIEDRHDFNLIRDHYAEMRSQLAERRMGDVRETINQMYRATQRIGFDARVATIGQGVEQVLERIERTRGMGGVTGVESHWPSMNEITGGYQDSDIISIIGRPGTGKTYDLLVEAQHAYEQGHSVLVVTTEMGIEPLSRRYTSIATGIDPTVLKHNLVDSYMERRIRSLHRGLLTNDRMRIFSVGMNSRLNAIEALINEFGPDIIFIDGAYLLHPSIKGVMKRIERVGEVYDELKAMNLQAKIPFVCTMQFNRQAGKDGKDGSLETIGFSDAVGMHSSLVLSLKYGPTENPRASRALEFMKGREGETGQICHHFKFAPVNFGELAPEDYQSADAVEHRTELAGFME